MQFKTPWPTFKEGHLGQLEHMDEIDLKVDAIEHVTGLSLYPDIASNG